MGFDLFATGRSKRFIELHNLFVPIRRTREFDILLCGGEVKGPGTFKRFRYFSARFLMANATPRESLIINKRRNIPQR